MSVRARVRTPVRAHVRACTRVCTCVRVCARDCACARVCAGEHNLNNGSLDRCEQKLEEAGSVYRGINSRSTVAYGKRSFLSEQKNE